MPRTPRSHHACLHVLALLLAACGDDGPAPTVAVREARLEPSPLNHLAATISFETDVAITPEVTVLEPDGTTWRVPPRGVLTAAPGTSHRVAVLGLKPERSYRFRIAGKHVVPDESLDYTPGAMPRNFPPIEVLASRPAEMAPGVTIFGLGSPFRGPWLVGIASDGEPVWYHRPDPLVVPAGVRALPDGSIAFVSTAWDEVRVIDGLGNPVATLRAAELGVDTFHHEPNVGPDGHLLLLSSELVTVSGYPGDQTLNLAGDVLVEVALDGRVVQKWRMVEVLDPHVITSDSLIPFWQGRYPEVPGLRDWSHLNSVWYEARDDSFIMSSLNLHLLFKMNRAGELQWVIGTDDPETAADDGWPWLRATGELTLPARHHSVQRSDDGDLLTYDNAFGTLASRPMVLSIDEQRREVRGVWDWYDPDRAVPLFSLVGGDFDPLPGGNVLVQAGVNTDFAAWITEIRYPSKEKVFQVRVPVDGGFNAMRVPSLYGTGSAG